MRTDKCPSFGYTKLQLGGSIFDGSPLMKVFLVIYILAHILGASHPGRIPDRPLPDLCKNRRNVPFATEAAL